MYDASPDNHMTLDFEKTKVFLNQFDWSMINAFGFYGGEPSIEMSLYDKFIKLVPENIQKFVITNGTWSKSEIDTLNFIKWCVKHQFHVIVSGTPEHQLHQARQFLEAYAPETNGALELKPADEIHAQGRAKVYPNIQSDCKMACQRTDRNIRLGLKPNGDVVFQNCHGEYHIVQTYNDPFAGIIEKVQVIKESCVAQRTMRID
jgi:hypothetical protein